MKKIEIKGNVFYFSLNANEQQIVDYISTESEYLGLNESYSCKIKIENNIVIISGDDDYVESEIEIIKPIF